MNRMSLVVLSWMVLMSGSVYAGSGDLVVDGKLGVGTAGPEDKLTIYGAPSGQGLTIVTPTAGNSAVIRLLNSYGTPSQADWRIQANAYTIGDFALHDYLKSATRFYISPTGNLGIGTTSPGQLLSLKGSSANLIEFQDSSGVAKGFIGQSYSSGQVVSDSAVGDMVIRTESQKILFTTSSYSAAQVAINGGNVGIGTTTPNGKLDVYGNIALNGTVIHTSDIKFKKNLLPIDDPLDKVLNLNGLSYEWKTDEYKDKGFPEGRHYGVIAQEIEKVLPEVVNTAADGTKAVAYTEIIPVLIEAIKAQQKIIERQQAELREIRALVGAK